MILFKRTETYDMLQFQSSTTIYICSLSLSPELHDKLTFLFENIYVKIYNFTKMLKKYVTYYYLTFVPENLYPGFFVYLTYICSYKIMTLKCINCEVCETVSTIVSHLQRKCSIISHHAYFHTIDVLDPLKRLLLVM